MWAPKPVIMDQKMLYSCFWLEFTRGHREIREYSPGLKIWPQYQNPQTKAKPQAMYWLIIPTRAPGFSFKQLKPLLSHQGCIVPRSRNTLPLSNSIKLLLLSPVLLTLLLRPNTYKFSLCLKNEKLSNQKFSERLTSHVILSIYTQKNVSKFYS